VNFVVSTSVDSEVDLFIKFSEKEVPGVVFIQMIISF